MNKAELKNGEGRLPAVAPLAYPFVPFQQENPPRYEPRKALIKGTLFPGLDLPFMGLVNKNEKPVTALTELQTVNFAIVELAQYLDTHREDTEAFEIYKALQKLYSDAKTAYEKECGPTTHFSDAEQNKYRWLNDPWPWEYANNREGK